MYKITILHQKSYPMKERGNTDPNEEKKIESVSHTTMYVVPRGKKGGDDSIRELGREGNSLK